MFICNILLLFRVLDGEGRSSSSSLIIIFVIFISCVGSFLQPHHQMSVSEAGGRGGASRKGRKELSVGDKNVKNAAANRGPSLNCFVLDCIKKKYLKSEEKKPKMTPLPGRRLNFIQNR